MWKKTESDEFEREETTKPVATPTPPRPEIRSPNERATIGPSITIHGDVTGEEDLLIQGRIEGKVDLKQNNVTIGTNGQVKADIYARTVTVEGAVEGSLFGDEQIVVRKSGQVRGDIVAPRVSLEDGATFKGSIDMDVTPKAAPRARPSPAVATPATTTLRPAQPAAGDAAAEKDEPKAVEKKG
jgi:cytoskeletal protein CcmA (bactofilin family)